MAVDFPREREYYPGKMGNDLSPKPTPATEVAKIENPVLTSGVNRISGEASGLVEGEAEIITSDLLAEEGLNNPQSIDTGSAATVEAVRTGRSVIINRKS